MARTKQTARKSTGGKAPRKAWGGWGPSSDEPAVNDVDALWPVKEAPAPMTTHQQEQIATEDRYRDLFANNRHSSELSDPHVLLTDVFANQASLQYQEEDEDEAAVPKILTKARVLGRTGPCFVSEQKFLSNWQSFTNDILKGLNWDNIFAAGGSVLANVINNPTEDAFSASDIDLFIYGLDTDEQANKKLEHIYSVVSKNSQNTQIIRSFRAVTILGEYPNNRHVQIILKLYKSPTEVLLGFDVDCCTFGFDGKKVWGMERGIRAVSKGYNLVNMSRRSYSYETRLRKYSKRGYAVAVPNLDKAQVDVSLFKKSAIDVQGLAKLLIYEYYELNPPFTDLSTRSYSTHKIIPRRYRRTEIRSGNMNADNVDIVRDITGNEDSDYAEFIPWGPQWYNRTILAMLDYKDRASAFSTPRVPAQKRGTPEKKAHTHNHSYVTGIKGVIEGRSTNFWCRYCKQNRPLEQGEDGKDVCGPLHWVNENQAYQDLDKGFRRNFVGVVQPALNENWAQDVYAAGYQPRDSPHPLKPSSASPVKHTSTFGSPSRVSTVSQDLFVGAGGQRFESENQMLRHQRENQGVPKPAASPFGDDIAAFGGRPSVDAFGGGTLPFVATAVSDTPNKSTIVRNLNSPQKPASQAFIDSYFQPAEAPKPTYNWGASANTSNNNNFTANAGAKSAHTVPPSWWSLFGKGSGSADSNMSYTSQALLLVAALYRKGAITLQFKSELKDLVLDNDPLVRSVVEAFFIDSDLVELVDSFTRVLSIVKRR